jgi:hypothetical protein
MSGEVAFCISAVASLVAAGAHAFVHVSKELRAWRSLKQRGNRNFEKSSKEKLIGAL